MNKNKGFTLIELLVVIAIIGILSSVVLASLNSARDSGADAKVKANLSNMRAEAAMYYDGNNGLTGFCDDKASTFGNGLTNFTCNVGAEATSWVAAAQLSTGTEYYCVDSAGNATTMSNNGAQAASNADAVDCLNP